LKTNVPPGIFTMPAGASAAGLVARNVDDALRQDQSGSCEKAAAALCHRAMRCISVLIGVARLARRGQNRAVSVGFNGEAQHVRVCPFAVSGFSSTP
jgi:hypothetical protein